MLSAIVSGCDGTKSFPEKKASINGLEPSACTPSKRGTRLINPNRFISCNPFPIPLIVQPSPTETTTQPGIAAPNCSPISNPAVFFPSTKKGFVPLLRLYQPNFSHASRQRSNACSYVPCTRITVAPKISNCVTFGSGARCGTKIKLRSPTAADIPASDDAALPVEAQAIVLNPNSSAFITPTELARSLNEFVGLRPSSFKNNFKIPMAFARRGTSYTGVQPTCKCGNEMSGETGSNSR